MVTLKDEISSQENMEQWMSQLGHPENPISNKGVLVRLQPQFVSCDFEKRENCIAFEDFRIIKFTCRNVHGNANILTRLIACRSNSLHNTFQRRFIVL